MPSSPASVRRTAHTCSLAHYAPRICTNASSVVVVETNVVGYVIAEHNAETGAVSIERVNLLPAFSSFDFEEQAIDAVRARLAKLIQQREQEQHTEETKADEGDDTAPVDADTEKFKALESSDAVLLCQLGMALTEAKLEAELRVGGGFEFAGAGSLGLE